MGIRKYSIAQVLRDIAGSMKEFKLYLDMDGVICDWDGAVKKLGAAPAAGLDKEATQEQKQIMYDAIEKAGPDFWAEMEWLEDGKKLWDLVKEYQPVLLTSPGKFRFAPGGKRVWVENNLPGVSVFIDEYKYEYAEMDSILIDDTLENISSFKAGGGEGIHHQDYETTKKELEELLN